MTTTVERHFDKETWRTWGVTCHPTGEGLDGHSWAWTVTQDRKYDPPRWSAYPPDGIRLTAPARDRWQRAVIDAVVSWERGEAGEGRA